MEIEKGARRKALTRAFPPFRQYKGERMGHQVHSADYKVKPSLVLEAESRLQLDCSAAERVAGHAKIAVE